MDMLNKVLGAIMSVIFFCAAAVPNALVNQSGGSDAAWPTEAFEQSDLPGWRACGLAMEGVYGLIGLMHGGPETGGLLIVHKGRIVYENYSNGQDADSAHAMYSVTKSVVSALAGIAIGEGYIKSVDQKVIEFYPDAVIAPGQESKRDMTIRQLLNMNAGLPGDSDPNDHNWWDAKDAGKAAFETPQAAAPGERFSYSSGPNMQALANLVSRAVGENLFDYAKRKLFGPLGMDSVTWDCAADGSPYGGFGLSMTPRDMARFGYLILQEGQWEGQQIIPAAYIAAALEPTQAHGEYGHLFWTFNKFDNFTGTLEANGAFGQYIDIFPEWDTVIVRTGDLGWLFENAAVLGIKYLGFDSALPSGVPLEPILGPLGQAGLVS